MKARWHRAMRSLLLRYLRIKTWQPDLRRRLAPRYAPYKERKDAWLAAQGWRSWAWWLTHQKSAAILLALSGFGFYIAVAWGESLWKVAAIWGVIFTERLSAMAKYNRRKIIEMIWQANAHPDLAIMDLADRARRQATEDPLCKNRNHEDA